MRRFYALLLNLYPRSYREEYGEELQAVFALSLADAANTGDMGTAKLLARELVGLPQGILFEHLRERRKTGMTKKFASHVSETIALVLPFLVVLALFFPIGMIQGIPARAVEIIRLSLLGILLVMFIVGLAKGLPRWILPYMGFVFAITNLFITFEIIDPKWRGFSFPPFVSRFVRDYMQAGVYWVGMIILVFMSVLLAALIPAFRPFYRRLRNDWTLLASIFYGVAPFAILVTFDDYEYAGPYVFVSFLILAFGGWLYLYNEASWKKYTSLFIGLTLAMAVTVIGAAVLVEDILYTPFATWQTAMVETIMTWVWLATFMLLPPLIKLLPQPKNRLQTARRLSNKFFQENVPKGFILSGPPSGATYSTRSRVHAFVVVAGNHGNCHHTDCAQDHGGFGEVLSFFFPQATDQLLDRVRLLQNKLASFPNTYWCRWRLMNDLPTAVACQIEDLHPKANKERPRTLRHQNPSFLCFQEIASWKIKVVSWRAYR